MGTFFITYTDVVVTVNDHAMPLEITPTYNSKATVANDFGYGWGWEYATNLVVA
jgi:hypothetical protein